MVPVAMQVVTRALDIVSLVAQNPNGLTLTEIAERLSLPVPTCHRIVGLLDEREFLSHSTVNRRYFLGRAVYALTEAHESTLPAAGSIQDSLERACASIDETTFLCQFVGDQVVCMALAEPPRALRMFVRPSQKVPLHAAAAARVLLAGVPEAAARRMLSKAGMDVYTTGTPRTVSQVVERLEVVRGRGYDVCESELDQDVWAVSVPVRGSSGRTVASVTIAAPAQRVPDQASRGAVFRAVLRCAAEVSADFGGEHASDSWTAGDVDVPELLGSAG